MRLGLLHFLAANTCGEGLDLGLTRPGHPGGDPVELGSDLFLVALAEGAHPDVRADEAPAEDELDELGVAGVAGVAAVALAGVAFLAGAAAFLAALASSLACFSASFSSSSRRATSAGSGSTGAGVQAGVGGAMIRSTPSASSTV